ncbi:MAG: hypothetical protein LUE06_07565 [Oscillospiraceae bacterium]|nr:hypothetical protein [Oscillospiraceae bacterium]
MGIGITRGAMTAINDLLDNCCEVKAGQEVVIAAEIDGLYGGDNLIDSDVIGWIQQAVQARGANCSILWIDEPAVKDKWRIPPVFLAALKACDVFINCSNDLTIEELPYIQQAAIDNGVVLCRNFAVTAALMNTSWAQTPYELLTEIRYQTTRPFGCGGMGFCLEAPNGTHLDGIVLKPSGHTPTEQSDMPYARYRKNVGGYRPFPEWVSTPVTLGNVNGIVVFDRSLSWWTRYLGIPSFFDAPVTITVENSVITSIEGKREADAIKRYLKDTEKYFGNEVYKFQQLHCGVHPCADVTAHQCPNKIYQRIIDHSGSNTIHMHIGAQWPTKDYPYRVHLTADVKDATLKVGEKYVSEKGHLTALDTQEVKSLMDKYYGRPGTVFVPKHE